MTERIIDISGATAELRVRHAQLIIKTGDGAEATAPVDEVAALVISNPTVMLSQAVLCGIAEAGGSVVICDRKFLPVAMLLPLQPHTTQAERFARQAAAPLPLRKQLWRQVVQAKIRAQARLLRELHGNDGGLEPMAARVRSGDAGNLESQASRRYWPLLFGDPHFRRGSPGPDQNAHLNYGYAVLRALTARAICGAGLHPSFGLQHHNRYDAFRLADDLMEPFRPVVDRAVYEWVQERDRTQPVDREAKAWLIAAVLERREAGGECRSLFDLLARSASSLAQGFLGQCHLLEIPEL